MTGDAMIVVYVEGQPVEVSPHDTAASAALRAGIGFTTGADGRTGVSMK